MGNSGMLNMHEYSELIYVDRSTVVGNIINNYLKQTQEVDDHAIHLMFSANRWEAM